MSKSIYKLTLIGILSLLLQVNAIGSDNNVKFFDIKGNLIGKASVSSTGLGLMVKGFVSQKFISQKGHHIDLEIKNSQEIKLPPIGWGNQFGFIFLENLEQCYNRENKDSWGGWNDERCAKWYAEQLELRDNVKDLFSRRWLFSKGYSSVEIKAKPVFEGLNQHEKNALSGLEPVIQLKPRLTIDSLRSYSIKIDGDTLSVNEFMIHYPWQALPPFKLQFSNNNYIFIENLEVRMQGSIFNENSSKTMPESTSKWHTINLIKRHDTILSECGYGPDDLEFYAKNGHPLSQSKSAEIYHIPNRSITKRLIVVGNPRRGYLYNPDDFYSNKDGKKATATSIIAKYAYFWDKPLPHYTTEMASKGNIQPITEGAHICGPKAAVNFKESKRFYQEAYRKVFDHVIISPDSLEMTPLLSNSGSAITANILIVDGPRVKSESLFGAGPGGSNPKADFNVYYLFDNKRLEKGFSLSDWENGSVAKKLEL